MLGLKIQEVLKNHGYEFTYTGVLEGRQVNNIISRKEEVYLLKGNTKFLLLKQLSHITGGPRKHTLLKDGKVLYERRAAVRDIARDLDAILEEYD